MLIVKPVKTHKQQQPELEPVKTHKQQQPERIKIGELCEKLEKMRKKCEDLDYALTTAPWPCPPESPDENGAAINNEVTTLEIPAPSTTGLASEAMNLDKTGSDRYETAGESELVVEDDMTILEVAARNTTRATAEATDSNEEGADKPRSSENGEEAVNDKMTILEVGTPNTARPPSEVIDVSEHADHKRGRAWSIWAALNCFGLCKMT